MKRTRAKSDFGSSIDRKMAGWENRGRGSKSFHENSPRQGGIGLGENNNRAIQVKPLKTKWYQFLIAYVIINICFFVSTNAVISYVYQLFSDMYVSNLYVDGTDFSMFANLISMPLAGVLAAITFILVLLFEVLACQLFKHYYFRSKVNCTGKSLLCLRIKATILCLALASILGTLFLGDNKRTLLYIILYLPVPLLTLRFIGKITRDLT